MAAPTPDRMLVVSAASRHGGTCEIADRLASTLRTTLADGWNVVRGDVADPHVFDDADAVVLGSAVYFGRWLHPATRALERIKDDPSLFGLWLFSTGPVSTVDEENAKVHSADAMVERGEAAEHMVFGGRLDPRRLSWLERLAVKAVHAIPGDRRDWNEVDLWAHHVADGLKAVPVREV